MKTNVFLAEEWLKEAMATYDSNLDWLVPDDMNVDDVDKRKEIGAQIRAIYTGGLPLVDVAIPSVRVNIYQVQNFFGNF